MIHLLEDIRKEMHGFDTLLLSRVHLVSAAILYNRR